MTCASKCVEVGASGFLDDEAMEVELSSEEWEEGSGESDEWVGEEEEGFVIDEAEDEEVYKARKRRRAILRSDSESEAEEVGKKRSCVDETRTTRKRPLISDDDESDIDEKALMEEEDEADESNSDSEDEIDESEGLGSDGDEGEREVTRPHHENQLRWKENLVTKAAESYKNRSSSSTNLRKLIYSDTPLLGERTEESSDEEKNTQEIGGLFQLTKKKALSILHEEDTSIVRTPLTSESRDWTALPIISAAKHLFVTGDWGENSAKTLLDEDDALYGDFEDLETGEKEGSEREEEKEEDKEKKRLEKKKKLKKAFDVGYDEDENGGGTYLDDLKREVSEQEQRNRAELEGMDEQTRLQLEGVRPGYYVRMELKGMKFGMWSLV